jgi:hypothetical protein
MSEFPAAVVALEGYGRHDSVPRLRPRADGAMSAISRAFRSDVISVQGYNLGDGRDPVLQSELGEGSSTCGSPLRTVFGRDS